MRIIAFIRKLKALLFGMKLNRTQAGSFIAGFQDLGYVDSTFSVSTFSLGAGVTNDQQFTIPFSKTDIISVTRLQMLGSSAPISSYWYPVTGALTFQDTTVGAVPIIIFTFRSNAAGRTLNMRLINNTAGAVTVPNLTINTHTRLYSYPF